MARQTLFEWARWNVARLLDSNVYGSWEESAAIRPEWVAANAHATAIVEAVLGALTGGKELSGYEIAEASDLDAGTLYPILVRLEESDVLASRWEDGERPRRRLYTVKQAADSEGTMTAR